jgi:hypothetical protein
VDLTDDDEGRQIGRTLTARAFSDWIQQAGEAEMRGFKDDMRRIRGSADPPQPYRMQLADGRDYAIAGAQLVAFARADVALQDAIDRNEPTSALVVATYRLLETLFH